MHLQTIQTKATTMKKLYSLGSIAALILALQACSKEADCGPATESFIINASCDGVRTTLSGNDVLWQDGDMVSAISCGESGKFSVAHNIEPKSFSGRNAVFEVTTLSGLQPRILVYPSVEGYALSEDGLLCAPVSDTFTASKDNAPDGGIYSAGVISDGKVTMKNLFSYLKFEIESSDISKIRLTANGGEALSGKIWFNLQTLSAVSGENNFVNVVPSGNSASFEPGTYYIPVPSCTLTEGITVKFFKTDGSAAKKKYESSYSVIRNSFIRMGKESDWALVFEPSSFVMNIDFLKDGAAFFPFSDNAAAVSAIACPAVSQMAGKGRKGPFYLLGYPGYEFHFNIQNTSGAKSYFVAQAQYVMRYGGTPGDYMTLPAVPGYRMTKLYFEEGSASSFYTITTDPASGNAEYLTAAEVTINKNTTKTFTFDATQTSAGTSYRLCTTRTNPTSIKKIELTYEVVD